MIFPHVLDCIDISTKRRLLQCATVKRTPEMKVKLPYKSHSLIHTRFFQSQSKRGGGKGIFVVVIPLTALALSVWAFGFGGLSLKREREGNPLPIPVADEIVYVSKVETLHKERRKRQKALLDEANQLRDNESV